VWNPSCREPSDPGDRRHPLVIAIVGKFASGWAVPWRRFNRRRSAWDAPRGEVGLIFAQIGLTAGILSGRCSAPSLFVVIATTLGDAPLLAVDPAGAGATLDEDSVP